MKAVMSWALVACLFLSLSGDLFAGDDTNRALLVHKLKKKVFKLIDTPQLKTVSSNEETVKISFRIDNEGKIQVKSTSTDNEELEKYIHERLDDQLHHRNLAGDKFVIAVDFKRSS